MQRPLSEAPVSVQINTLDKCIREFVKGAGSPEEKAAFLANFKAVVDSIENTDILTDARRFVDILNELIRAEIGRVDQNINFELGMLAVLNKVVNWTRTRQSFFRNIYVNPLESRMEATFNDGTIGSPNWVTGPLSSTMLGYPLGWIWIRPFIYHGNSPRPSYPMIELNYNNVSNFDASVDWWKYNAADFDPTLEKYRLPPRNSSLNNVKIVAYIQTLAEMKKILIQHGATAKRSLGMVLFPENAANEKVFRIKKGGEKTRKIKH